jgi:hypothetical protein
MRQQQKLKYTSEKVIQQCLVSITTHFSYGHRPTFEMVTSEINDKKCVEKKIENMQSKKRNEHLSETQIYRTGSIGQRF